MVSSAACEKNQFSTFFRSNTPSIIDYGYNLQALNC